MGGGEIALLHLVTHADRRRYQPVVLLFASGPLAERLIEAGIETHVVPLDRKIGSVKKDSLGGMGGLRPSVAIGAISYCFKLAFHIKRLRVELVHTNSLKADILGGIAAKIAGVPVVWHIRDRIDRDYLPAPVVSVFRFLCASFPTRVIANSAATLSTIVPGRRGPACHTIATSRPAHSCA